MIIDQKYTGLPKGVHLNEMQELVDPHKNEYYNVLISAPTASGKSTTITMLGKKFLDNGYRVVYLGITKALVKEKAMDWAQATHPWSQYEQAVITGDTRGKSIGDAESADVICMTPEALASRLRNITSDRNTFLQDVGLLVIDEIHLLTSDSRGANLEAAIIEFISTFPDVQILGLSATIPNVDEMATWLTNLNGTHTEVIVSDYRPIPLFKHFYPIAGFRDTYTENLLDRILTVIGDRSDEQHLICVWSKAFGRRLEKFLRSIDIECAFHNANVKKETRDSIESQFRNRKLKVLIATSTLITGVNLPARNVHITALVAGGNDLPTYELNQAMGRAGRPAYDTQGHVHIYSPQDTMFYHKTRLQVGDRITSQLMNIPLLATHFLGAVYLKRIVDEDSFHDWFDLTLAQIQFQYTDSAKQDLLNGVLIDMQSHGMVRKVVDGAINLTHLGKICAQMYMDPYHLSSAVRNFRKYFQLTNPNDYDLAVAIGTCAEYADLYVAKDEEASCSRAIIGMGVPKMFWKSCTSVYACLKAEMIPWMLQPTHWKLRDDLPRLHAAIVRVHNELEHWEGVDEDELDQIFVRVIMQMPKEAAMVPLRIFTRSERTQLFALGLYTMSDIRKNLSLAKQVIGEQSMAKLETVENSKGEPYLRMKSEIVKREKAAGPSSYASSASKFKRRKSYV